MPKPLLRTGELRDSIEYTVSGLEGAVGSDSEIPVFQALGTSRIPPRSFLVSSAMASEDKIHRMAAAATIGALSGYGRHAKVRAHLDRALSHLQEGLAEDLGPEFAAKFVAALKRAVMLQKAKLERGEGEPDGAAVERFLGSAEPQRTRIEVVPADRGGVCHAVIVTLKGVWGGHLGNSVYRASSSIL